MKAEHRKELQTNALADSVGRFLQGLKSGPSRNSVLTWGIAALIVLGALGLYYYTKWSGETRSSLWVLVDEGDRRLGGAGDLGDVEAALNNLAATAKEHPGEIPTRVMRFTRARTLLRLGLERLYAQHDRKKALEQIEEARALYQQLAGESGDTPVLAQEGLMGVARAEESLGRIEEALTLYQKVARLYPQSALGKAAAERVTFLESAENRKQVEELYAQLEKLAADRGKPPPTPPLSPPTTPLGPPSTPATTPPAPAPTPPPPPKS